MGHIHYHWSNRSSTTSLDTLGNLPCEDSGIWISYTGISVVTWDHQWLLYALRLPSHWSSYRTRLWEAPPGKRQAQIRKGGLEAASFKTKGKQTSSLTELGNGILCPHWLAPGMAALRLWGLLLWEEAQVSMPASTVLQPLENPSALALVLFLLKQNT